MYSFSRSLIVLAFILFVTGLQAQLINIESKRMRTDSIRFAMQNHFEFNLTNNDGSFI